MEVDAENDEKGDKRVFDSEPGETQVGELAALAPYGGEEGGILFREVVDVDFPFIPRGPQAEAEGVVGVGKGRYVEILRYRPAPLGRGKVGPDGA